MHNNYYFLRQLSRELEKALANAIVSECFSQNKDELIVRFELGGESFFIKASLLPGFSCLSFPENFSRAKKNSVDLFEKIIGQRVTGIQQFKNERSFAIALSDNLFLLFKMHGNRSNIILFEKELPVELFKNSIHTDREIDFSKLDRVIDWSFEDFKNNQDRLPQLYFTFGKVVWHYLESQNFSDKTLQQKWEAIQQVRAELEDPTYYNTELTGMPVLSLVKVGNIVKEWHNPVKACNDFYYTYTQTYALRQEKNSLLSELRAKLHNSKNYLSKTLEKLKEVEDNSNYKIWADLLMANIHLIKPNTDRVTVQNFYHDNESVEIRLKKDLSPQRNAELFYKKSKNQHLEIERLRTALLQKEKEIGELEEKIVAAEALNDLTTLRTRKAEWSPEKETNQKSEALPYHEFVVNGFKIWVGKNAKSNDTLTLKLSHKDDLWLHAKDVSGSHVLIKYQAGKKFPKNVIERAAQLAAYNSKRKTETLAAVVYTPKKYVRKRKGDPAGTVVVEREEVIMVEPKL